MARLQVSLPLRWSDQDAYGHINNVSYARYLEEARVQAFSRSTDGVQTGLETLLAGTGETAHQMLLASQGIEFVGMMHYGPEPALVEMWVAKVGGSSIELHVEIIDGNNEDRAVVARAISTMVIADSVTGRPKRLEAPQRDALAQWSDAPLRLRRG